MARKVFLHVGLPKTGTTYLQSIVWANKTVLREQGVLLPGFGPRQHLWVSCVVREEQHLDRRFASCGGRAPDHAATIQEGRRARLAPGA